MGCTFGGEDGEVVEADVNQIGIASREAGELDVVFEVANEGVLVVVIHVGDDALLRCGIGCLGGFFRHSDSARRAVAEVFGSFKVKRASEVARRGLTTFSTFRS